MQIVDLNILVLVNSMLKSHLDSITIYWELINDKLLFLFLLPAQQFRRHHTT